MIGRATHPGGQDLAFSSDNQLVLSFGDAPTVIVWELKSGEQRHELHCSLSSRMSSGGINRAEFSPDGTRILAAVRNEEVQIWDLKRSERVLGFREVAHESWSTVEFFASFNADGQRVAVWSYHGVRVYDVTTGRAVTPRIAPSAQVTQARFASDGQHLLTAGSDGTVCLWNFTAPDGDHLTIPWIGPANSCRWLLVD